LRRRKAALSALPLLFAAGALFLAASASVGQHAEQLPGGPGADLVQARCTPCHDLGNITRIRQTREEWQDTIRVMINRGAPVAPAEEAVILDYLTRHYGR
jgi:hypothetical protein